MIYNKFDLNIRLIKKEAENSYMYISYKTPFGIKTERIKIEFLWSLKENEEPVFASYFYEETKEIKSSFIEKIKIKLGLKSPSYKREWVKKRIKIKFKEDKLIYEGLLTYKNIAKTPQLSLINMQEGVFDINVLKN